MRRITLAAGIAAVIVIAIAWVAVRSPSGPNSPVADPAVTAPPSVEDSRTVEQRLAIHLPADLKTWQAMIAESDDLKGLLNSVMTVRDPALQQAVVTSIIDRWLLVEPAGFIKYLNAMQVSGDHDSLAVVALALQDSLTRLTVESAGSDEILVVVQRLISYLASTDPAKALEWARRFLLDDTLDSAVVSIARGMSRTDVGEALRIAGSIQSPLRRSQAFAAVGTVWAASNPVAALGWAVSLKNHGERALTINSVLLVTASQNPPAAARSLSDQAKRINDQYVQERAAQLAAAGITEADLANDPDSFREMLEAGTIPPPSSPDIELLATASKVIGSKLASGDPAAALDWAQALDGDFLKLTSLSGVLEGWAKTDPAAALAFVSQNHPANGDLLDSVYRAWAAADPRAAATATRQIEDPNRRQAALENVVKVWAIRGDPDETAGFLSQLPASENTDAASCALATAISFNQPERAWQIAQSITAEATQYRALKSAFSVLVTRDPEAAGQLLATSNLPARTTELLTGVLKAVTGG